jgi:hypothetical protein
VPTLFSGTIADTESIVSIPYSLICILLPGSIWSLGICRFSLEIWLFDRNFGVLRLYWVPNSSALYRIASGNLGSGLVGNAPPC